ncbi:undecaprenyldiphospho-muramoylpentapeptide beta-N-acetylglucosaminyltransferase [Rhizobium sp. KVB221]|uniref:UDP-N-acetylglucosamine--N-acetylmuramyl-(pentapeptide) pyrophosphoryl-undecaprenol N-acetylglucosamine transferase n=1 Tax=Rhizobium setariae TaxID=2801340 RepID=A0A936YVH6_9HYPH|nr:undecaprenyldiphospho-muramoylpentapeptide beta-N-acetylglucosaminyltransferase [Rhizobium setariae]MBL0374476.1 undecaprenyldiphospho-muramoylpentapeptide beta-N-acetylglucosaminyltransferase [Rhizobium setariae]
MGSGLIVLAAGGTGGHLFPAEALGHELKARGYQVHLVTDSRAERFAGKFPADEIHVVPSATIGSKNPIAVARALFTLWKGMRTARALFSRLKPRAVIGFGGYPTVPPLLAASSMGIPTLIHEQNAVMGRANKMLAAKVMAIAGGFLPEGSGKYADKTVVTGNPVRPDVIAAAGVPYKPSGADDLFNLLVFGGSQGAQYFSSVVPSAICLLEDRQRKRLRVVQQARPEDAEKVTAAFAKLGLSADVSPFFADMPGKIADANLVICRSGASTVSELAVIGRPSVLVPYPYALDHDQAANAAALKAEGGAEVIAQSALSPEKLSDIIGSAMADPARLDRVAHAAKATGKPQAATALGDLVEAVMDGRSVVAFKEVLA